MWFWRNKAQPDTTEPQRVIENAKAATLRSQAQERYVEIVADRLKTRVDENHFAESLLNAWTRREA